MNIEASIHLEEVTRVHGQKVRTLGRINDKELTETFELEDLLDYLKASLIITTDEVLKDEQARGFDKKPVIAVDGSISKSILNVNPFGSIEITSRSSMKEILLDTYQAISTKSPVLTGRYKSSNFVFHNGIQVATDLSSLESWLNSSPKFEDKDLIRFVNIQPYARKLERQGIRAGSEGKNIGRRRDSRSTSKSGKVRVRLNQPNGAYYLTSRTIRNKYKRNSVIKFEFIGGGSLGISGSFKAGRKGKPGRPYLYPSIVISVRESGIV